MVVEWSSAGTFLTVNGQAGSVNAALTTVTWGDFPLILFATFGTQDRSTRAIIESLAIQSPIPTPSTESDLTVITSTSQAFNDGLYAFYKSQGAIGEQLNDLEKDFWCRVAQPQNAPLPWILSDNSGNVLSDNSGTSLRT